MVYALIRSPCSFFDVTPSGRLSNIFSNDMGVMEITLPFALTDAVEGPILCGVMLINVFTINLLFLPLGIFNLIVIVLFYRYCKRAIISVKQLDLRMKSPMFNMVNEMISGLIQIRIFGQRARLLK